MVADQKKDDFLAILAHELRNPLAPIRTGLHLLRQPATEPEAPARILEMIERQVAHLVRLVDDLLDTSRITTGKLHLRKQPTKLSALVNTAIESHRASIQAAALSLDLELPEPTPILEVDPTRFVQVLSNLLHNAIKFSNRGGQIRVSATCDDAATGTRSVSVAVVDGGAGISKEMLPRVFDMFAQEHAATTRHDGLGIGLALARSLIRMHGGSIEAESQGPGMGSRFTVRIPESSVSVEECAPVSAVAVRLKLSVVVVDDNVDAADTLALLVGAMGATCRVAYDGDQGLQRALDFRPHVMFLDIGMPGMDGYETCRRIRCALGPEVFLVALTGLGQERDKARAVQAGFDAHLTKPADPKSVLGLLNERMARIAELDATAARESKAPVP